MVETHDVTDDYGNRLYSVTTVQGAKPKPAEAFAALRAEFGDVFDAMPDYDTRTSTDRIDELNRQMAALRAEFHALSERMYEQGRAL